MARVTVEDCVDKIPNRFDLVVLASQRARNLSSGEDLTVEQDNDKNPNQIVEKEGLIQQSDPNELEKIIVSMLSKNQDKVTQYKSGKEKLFGYFVGEVMKASKGKANPQLVNEILKKKLH